jgi:uncharacterized protein
MTNRLARESSPYLVQHAENPVDWYPWGEEALERARREDRPILLSIGYSACHWCHVMERESFEDPGVAEVMNERFVNIKVDREERPDLDSIYMRAVQALTGHGGWPLTAFLTPEGVPFYGGTYFPPEPRHGMPSFRQVLEATGGAYRDRREEVASAAEEIRSLLERSMAGDGRDRAPDEAPSAAALDRAFQAIASRFDPLHGGFGSAPKFPQPLTLDFCLRQHARTGDGHALTVVTHSLAKMARGGMHDQLAGGFHRYSVDARWLVPHFEKMLYDNALLARLYLHAFLVTGDDELGEVTEKTLDYLLDDMRAPEGGFYSARDADSEGEEGLFYLWTAEEVDALLQRDDARLFRRCYDVSEGGNFEGRNILHLPHDLEAVARSENLRPEELREKLDELGAVLLEARSGREAPFRDEKVLAGWNGLAIQAFAEAGAALGRDDYRDAAATAADFILARMVREGVLHRSWKDGEARIPGFLEDYASIGLALLTLHETTAAASWLEEAIKWTERLVELFWSGTDGIFYDTASGSEPLVVRPREIMDNATPSGSSLAVELCLRLGHLLGRKDLLRIGAAALAGGTPQAERYPSAFGRLLAALDFHLSTPVEIAVVGAPDDPLTEALLHTIHGRYLPNRVVLGRAPGEELPGGPPLMEGRSARGGVPTAYVCEGYTCQEPVSEPEALAEQLGGG